MNTSTIRKSFKLSFFLFFALLPNYEYLHAEEIHNHAYNFSIDNFSSLTLLSYGSYDLPAKGKKSLVLQILVKNDNIIMNNKEERILYLRNKDKKFFELKNRKNIYTPKIFKKSASIKSLSPGNEYIFFLEFLVEHADSFDDFELRYAKDDIIPVKYSAWIPLKQFLSKGPQDTQLISRYGYFTVIGYAFYIEGKKNKKRLKINLKLGNNRNYNSYFVIGFMPETHLTYAKERYFFELTDGKEVFRPKNPVPRQNLHRPEDLEGKSTEKVLIPSDVRELSLTFVLNKNTDPSTLSLRYKDHYNYVKPSSWLPLGPYFENVPPIRIKILKPKPQDQKKETLK